MIFHETRLGDAWLIELEPSGDERGMFARALCREDFGERGLLTDYVPLNISLSAHKGQVRGMHSHRAPHTAPKLVRCSRGELRAVTVERKSVVQTGVRPYVSVLEGGRYLKQHTVI